MQKADGTIRGNSQSAPYSADEVLGRLRPMRGELRRRFTVRRLGVFGSCVRGQAGPASDVDVLVDLEQPTFDHYMDLKFRLEEVLGRDVDLVLADTLKPRLRPIVERESSMSSTSRSLA